MIAGLGTGAAAQSGAVPAQLRAQYDSAFFAWDRGDYVTSLEHAERLLEAPGGQALLQQVALLTGELYEVEEIAPDGEYLRWSADGRYLSYETGTGGQARTHVVEVTAQGIRAIGDFHGWDARFSPDGTSLAYFRLPESAELTEALAQAAQAQAAGDRAAERAAMQRIAELEAARAEIVLRGVTDGAERVLAAAGLERYDLGFGGDGSVILVGREPGQGDRTDLYLLAADGAAQRLSDGPGSKGSSLFAVGQDRIVYSIGNDQIAIQNIRTGEARTVAGEDPAVSRDGSTLAYITVVEEIDPDLQRGEAFVGADGRASGDLTAVMVLSLDGASQPREVRRTTLPIADPAVSPNGTRVAYNIMPRDDWEIFAVNADGTDEQRVTREIQHDLYPAFLSETLILSMMGEARHRRSYLHDIGRDRAAEIAAQPLPGDDQRGRVQVFHNNTIRTVAPQYEWSPSPDGSRIAVVADRDGNTLSAERGVYLVDLSRQVGRDAVLERVRTQLAGERQLRAWGREMFAPIEAEVRAATAEVDAGRVYDHAHALYQFDSKHITQPGNALAVEYLANSLRAMGYEPELQWFEPRPGIQSANVVVTVTGTQRPELINMVSSHLDSVERGPGADDNTSGSTALLEVARVLANRPQPETIRMAFLTGEEAGLLGGREFVRRAQADGEQIVSALNNDMIGWTRSHRLDNTIRYSNDVIRDITHNAAILFSDLITYDARYVRSTDAQAFWDAYGDIIGGIGSYPILGNPHYHRSHDQLEVINQRLVAEVARTTAATLMLLAQGVDIED
ncbi:MAG: M28 family peptidase [Gemmatimonadota bacterium]